jgi:hypothetical protein
MVGQRLDKGDPMRFKLGRPSPALVIACISLFVALGGVGYAAATGSIDGREIKNNSVASKDLKNSSIVSGDVKNSTLIGSDIRNNAVKGSDVDEGTLGKVPSAGQADNAATAGSASTASSAGNANTVGGNRVRTFSRGIPENTVIPEVLVSARGFSLLAACDAAGEPKLTVDTTRDNTRVYYDHIRATTDTHTNERNEDLDAAEPPLPIDGGTDDGVGTLTIGTMDGNALTVNFSFGDVASFDVDVCAFVGSAIG